MYIVTLPHDSTEFLELTLYCQQHDILLRQETLTGHQSGPIALNLIYDRDHDQQYIMWLKLAYPNCLYKP